MSPRLKKLLGLFLLLPALLVYFGAVVTLADMLPSHWLVKLIYFVIAGLLWALPMIPFMRWMERTAEKKPGGKLG